MPSTSGSPPPDPLDAPAGYASARASAGVIDRRQRGRLVVSGEDRRSYLHGLLTNDITALTPGTGCYACYLTAQGRMISDLWVFELGDLVLLTLPLTAKDTVLAKLDQFVFSEDVQLGDVTAVFGSLAVIGPSAAAVVASVLDGADDISRLAEGGNRRLAFEGQPAIALGVGDLGLPGIEVLVDSTRFDALYAAVRAAGAAAVSAEAAEALRVEGGVPLFPQDMDGETIPLEAGIEKRAISLTKGCYVGQEVIIRVLHRGHGKVARKLVGLTIEGRAVPPAGTPISAEGRAIGRVTSAVASPMVGKPVALGYVHRDFASVGSPVLVGDDAASVTDLPFAAAVE